MFFVKMFDPNQHVMCLMLQKHPTTATNVINLHGQQINFIKNFANQKCLVHGLT
jgi:hypothetical protein